MNKYYLLMYLVIKSSVTLNIYVVAYNVADGDPLVRGKYTKEAWQPSVNKNVEETDFIV